MVWIRLDVNKGKPGKYNGYGGIGRNQGGLCMNREVLETDGNFFFLWSFVRSPKIRSEDFTCSKYNKHTDPYQ